MIKNSDNLAEYVQYLRNNRSNALPLNHGKPEKETLLSKKSNKIGIQIFFGTIVFFVMIKLIIMLLQYGTQLGFVGILFYTFHGVLTGATIGAILAMLYWLIPLFSLIGHLVICRKLPERDYFDHFATSQVFVSYLSVSFLIVFIFKHQTIIGWINILWNHHGIKQWEVHDLVFFFGWWILCTVLLIIASRLILLKNKNRRPIGWFNSMRHIHSLQEKSALYPDKVDYMRDFHLFLGHSTGQLTERQHPSGISKDQAINLGIKDAILNILIFGGLGSGKTSSLINPLLLQLMDDGYGGLIFDVKGSFKKIADSFASHTDREIHYLGPNHQPMNLIDGLKPETAAEYVKAAIVLDSPNDRGNSHWLEAANQLASSVLGLLSFLPEHYTLENMHRFIYEKSFREQIQTSVDDLLSELGDRDKRLIKHYRYHYENVFTGKYEKYQQSVTGTMDKALAGFTHPDIADAFCAAGKEVPDMSNVTDGEIYLLDMKLGEWGSEAKIVYMLLKLRFFSVVKERQAQPDWDFLNPKEKPIFFICDEYQEIIDCSASSLSDLNFWDKAKDAKCIGIISAQSIKSIYSKIGDRDAADTVLQNFRQKICFKTEDQTTIQYFEYIVGKVEAGRRGYSKNEGKTKHDFKSSRHNTSGESLTFIDRAVIDPQVFRNMDKNEAIALLNINELSMDDVITVCDAIHG